jgi:hypothetical protein
LESYCFEEILLSLLAALLNSLRNVLGKLRLHHNVVVQVVFQVLGALVSAMPVENAKNLDLGPTVRLGRFVLRLDDIEYDCDTIFVCLAHSANIGVGRKGSHNPKGLLRAL